MRSRVPRVENAAQVNETTELQSHTLFFDRQPCKDNMCADTPDGTYMCYLIQSEAEGSKSTYVGVTNNLTRRIKQHNGRLKGGAKSTMRCRPWVYAAWVGPFETYRGALQFEYAWKHAAPRRSHGLKARVNKLRTVLMRDRWTRNAVLASEHNPLTVTVLSPEFAAIMEGVEMPCHVVLNA